ncbi:hypothetical protein [Nocardia seriolae]|uniref:Uncharacterized protein n=1 Tax=Nocardia seriolae TaxID=37332 RepID=A0A0B8N678_9NOCA|nr:hypothetical protein [Nocardia seriolae]APB01708.1 hypothetical protein NS506_07689 [Nocardia seriolae]MTJ60824.1 hypothetical protein [Nocardia seriolae]MTJ76117.1 hypothetical protein [Nocardia seriolae]MTJ91034.1 hypothetical protein [Nocardia seriolae]MTK34996.1 hypothetical protein [Nocardia seriolae]
MTDYLRPMAAYVATRTGHRRPGDGHLGQASADRVTAPDRRADTTEDTPDNGADRGRTR